MCVKMSQINLEYRKSITDRGFLSGLKEQNSPFIRKNGGFTPKKRIKIDWTDVRTKTGTKILKPRNKF